MKKPVLMKQHVSDGVLHVVITFPNPSHIGRLASLRLKVVVGVHDSRPVDASKKLWERTFEVSSSEVTQSIPLSEIQCFTYQGRKIDIQLHLSCEVDDGILFDTSISEEIILDLMQRPRIAIDAKGVIDPKDMFRFFKNLQAIPLKNQIATLGLAIVGGIVILINILIGLHDQSVSPNEIWLYAQRDSDGDAESPLINALLTSGPIGVAIWYGIKGQLRKYMSFFWKKVDFSGEKGMTYAINEYLSGKSRVDLKNVTVRIVAANIEKGQYTRGSGTKTRTVSFKEPVHAIVLYSEVYEFIPKNTDLDSILHGTFSFDEMYRALYPELEISSTHGLETVWEAQLLHDEFIDQELYGSKKFFHYENFLDA